MKLMPFHKVSSIWYLVSGIRNTKYKQSLRSSSLRTAGLKIQNTKYCKSFGFTLIELLVACHPKPWRKKAIHGFTLIELLVVISIIGILAAFIVASFTSAQQKARDSKRKADLDAVKKALVLASNDCTGGGYPIVNPLGTPAQKYTSLQTLLQNLNYMKQAPQDPTQSGTSPYTYD